MVVQRILVWQGEDDMIGKCEDKWDRGSLGEELLCMQDSRKQCF